MNQKQKAELWDALESRVESGNWTIEGLDEGGGVMILRIEERFPDGASSISKELATGPTLKDAVLTAIATERRENYRREQRRRRLAAMRG